MGVFHYFLCGVFSCITVVFLFYSYRSRDKKGQHSITHVVNFIRLVLVKIILIVIFTILYLQINMSKRRAVNITLLFHFTIFSVIFI